MVDYNDEAHAKHQKMQDVLADMRKRAETVASPIAVEDDASILPDDVEATTPAPSPAALPLPSTIRFAGSHDMFAMEVLDRIFPQHRATATRILPRTTVHIPVRPQSGTMMVAPRAWSFRIRDSDDPSLRRTAVMTEVAIDSVRQMVIDRRQGIETDELEADYYRIALESGKEATLVARDISGFGVFTELLPLEVALFNPSDRHSIDILIRVWGGQPRIP